MFAVVIGTAASQCGNGHAAIGAGDDLMHVNLAISVTATNYSRLARMVHL
jgi:hypothetical protein